YKDVKASDWYCGYIETAYEYKLISGCTDEFSPLDRITREQAMVMLARAMSITGIGNTSEKAEAEKLLSSFIDSNEISGYARKEAADCVKAGIVTGKSDRIAAKGNITRAEAAVMIQRLLEKSNLIG
ncbi:MAG: S-layer homology domain-containing protein, partial [Clostridiaceae bacterium]|nr:S-layer homology domain-containing protein [Clostridiaceae bacterium]